MVVITTKVRLTTYELMLREAGLILYWIWSIIVMMRFSKSCSPGLCFFPYTKWNKN